MLGSHGDMEEGAAARKGETMAHKHRLSKPPPADDHELRRKWIEPAVLIIGRAAAYIIITHWRHWGL